MFDEIRESPGSARSLRSSILQFIKKYIAPSIKGGKLLDVGGGTGEFTEEIASVLKVEEVVVVDINEDALKDALSRGFKSYKVDVTRKQLPFSDNYFDIVTMIDVIEHLYDPDYAISEVRKVLKPGGFAVISTPNLAWWVNRLVLLLGVQPYFSSQSARFNVGKLFRPPNERAGVPGHIRLYTLKAFKQFIELHDFHILVVKGSPGDHRSASITLVDSILSLIPSLAAEIIATLSRM
ncbi:MAG: class I SAM-dependent methyltransferase [Infirmifilum sp.]